MRILSFARHAIALTFMILLPSVLWAADIDRFVGEYYGQADAVVAGEIKPRDLQTTVEANGDGFNLSWTSVTHKEGGNTKAKTYEIEFVPSQRSHIFASAMKTNIFGKQVPLDPLKGEPFVWSRFEDDTFSVFSLFINEAGEYEMQEYHRTLAEGGLNLLFRRVSNGVPQKEVTAFLARQ